METKMVCMDYDSMGDYSRFPRKKVKRFISLRERLIQLLIRKQK